VKALVAAVLLVTFAAVSAQQPDPPPATYVTAADIAATLKQMPPTAVSDRQIRMIDAGGYNVGVGVVHRPAIAKQGSIEHNQLTEVYYVLEGTGTLVTGGVQIDAKPIAADSTIYKELTGPSSTGTGVQRGESRRIAPGDVVIIPARVPHWFSDIDGTIKYLVIRVDPERVLIPK
jgi:mannose-6-phosphate isomerase-like protein (cupin superfamily)